MDYLALYRKYRPQTFNDIIGQETIKTTLQNALKSNTVSHAYLFSGPRGTGKTTLARLFGKALNCLSSEDKPCEVCENCIAVNNNAFPDFIEMDGASNNGVDEIRDLRDRVKYAPHIGKYKVYVIDEVHMLTTGAFNALLKTLEEPPPNVVFLLATTEKNKIPETILSRVVQFDVKSYTVKEVENLIRIVCAKEEIKITSEAIHSVATSANGGLRDALTLLEQLTQFQISDEITLSTVHEVTGNASDTTVNAFFAALETKDKKTMLHILNVLESENISLDIFIENVCKAIVQSESPTASQLTAITFFNQSLIHSRFYRQGNSAIKLAVVQFVHEEDRITKLENRIKALEAEKPNELKVDKLTELDNVEISKITSVAEVEKITEKVQDLPRDLAFLDSYKVSEHSTVEDVKARNDIYVSDVHDQAIEYALTHEEVDDHEPVLISEIIKKEHDEKKVEKKPLVVPTIELTKDNISLVDDEIIATESAIQSIIPKHTAMRVMIEAALNPERSAIKQVKRRWELLGQASQDFYINMLSEAEPKACVDGVLVISVYMQSLKHELEQLSTRIEIKKIFKQFLKIDYNYIVLTEKEWQTERATFMEQWKSGLVTSTLLDEMVLNEKEVVVDGQLEFEVVETTPKIIKDAQDLFGDLVEIK